MEAKAILFTLYILHFINELYFGYSRAFSITSPVLGLQNNHPALCGLGHLAVHTEYSGSKGSSAMLRFLYQADLENAD